jgi:hypothetical protein
MNFACHPAPRPPHRLTPIPRDAGSMLMHADNGRVDHLDGGVMGSCQGVYDAAPDTSPSPPNEAVVAGGVAMRQELPSEGNGHTFESCRVRQFIFVCSPMRASTPNCSSGRAWKPPRICGMQVTVTITSPRCTVLTLTTAIGPEPNSTPALSTSAVAGRPETAGACLDRHF